MNISGQDGSIENGKETFGSQLYRDVVQMSPDGIFINRHGKVAFINDAGLKLLRASAPEEVLGRAVLDLFHPDCHEIIHGRVKKMLNSPTTVPQIEEKMLSLDGSVIEVEVAASSFHDGDGLAIQVVFRDISERKRVEERLREQASLLDQARDAIVVQGLDHTIQFWNRGAERLYGWTREEAVGGLVENLLYKDPKDFRCATEEVMNKGEWSGEIRQIAQDGREFIVAGRWTLVRGTGDGKPSSILIINTDISERKKLEAQFLRAQRMESIGTLAGGIAHDLNNVLAPILMSISLLKQTADTDEEQEILEVMAASVRRGADMVSQVLSFARGVEGRRIEIQITHLVRDVEKIIRDTLPKNIGIRMELEPGLPVISGDPTQLHQVLLNLCVNARDAMPNGGTLLIKAEKCVLDEQYAAMNLDAKAGPYVLVQVKDTGTGIDPGLLEKIFEPFFTTKETGKGTGLGLSTSQAIVKSHGGFIRVCSEPGNGTQFNIYLPALEKESGGAQEQGEEGQLLRGKGELVLVVDDETAIRKITSQTLETFGYRVLQACDGAEAVALFASRQNEIDIVLTDMMMPIMDGSAMIQVLLKLKPDVKIVAVSGIAVNRGAAQVAHAGVCQFLPKPYTAEHLLETLRKVLDGDPKH